MDQKEAIRNLQARHQKKLDDQFNLTNFSNLTKTSIAEKLSNDRRDYAATATEPFYERLQRETKERDYLKTSQSIENRAKRSHAAAFSSTTGECILDTKGISDYSKRDEEKALKE